jgi:PAS domain S-box-containing protein
VNYRTVLDSLADAIVVGDLDGRIVHLNPAAERLLGWKAVDVEGQSMKVLMSARMHAAHSEGFQRFVTTRQPRIMGRAVRVPALRKDGVEIDVELALSPLAIGEERPLIVASMRDLSDRVELERQLRISRYLKAVSDSAAALTQELDAHHVMRTAADRLVTGFEAALGRVWLFDRDKNLLLLRASAGLSVETERSSRAIIDVSADASKVATVTRTLVPFVQNDLDGETAVDQEWVRREGIRSVAVMPLVVGAQLLGVLVGFFRMPLDAEVSQALVTFTALAASALNDSLLFDLEKAARERFEDFVNGIDHGIVWEAEAKTLQITFVSAKAERLLGYRLADWYERPRFWIDRVHAEDRERVLALLSDAVEHDKDIGFEHRFVTSDGGVISVHTGARLAQTGPGAGVMIHALSVDVTDIKAAEARAAAAARQLDTILRGVSEGITAQGSDGRLLYANDAAARLTGFSSAAEMLAAPLRDITSRHELIDDDGESVSPDRLPGRMALQGKTPEEVVLCFRNVVTGERRWSIVSARPVLSAANEVEMVINVFRDVTTAKRAEQGLRFLAAASALLGSSLDVEETLRVVVKIALPQLGDFAFFDVMEGAEVRRLAVAHEDPAVDVLLASMTWGRSERKDKNLCALSSGETGFHPQIGEAWMQDVAASREHLDVLRRLHLTSMITVPLRGRGEVLGSLTLCFGKSGRHHTEDDVTLAEELARRAGIAVVQARLYDEARSAVTAAEEASRVKDEFLATVSHELRTPLNAIVGWSSLLHLRSSDPFVAKGIDVIARNAKAQGKIIEDILDASRINTGQLRLELETADLASIVHDAIDVVRPSAVAKGIEIEFTPPPEPCLLVADAARLQQVVWNLLSNAVKFTGEAGTIKTSIECGPSKLVLSVTDSGSGIEPEFLPHVFERFKQADGSSTRRVGGLGLGLAIVRQIVELHGGQARATSAGPGTGSTFTVTFPVRAVAAVAEGKRPSSPEDARPE